jgi:hypothetical protein
MEEEKGNGRPELAVASDLLSMVRSCSPYTEKSASSYHV